VKATDFKELIEKIPHRKRDLYVALLFGAVLLALFGTGWWTWKQYRTSAPYVDPKRYPVRGIDVSAHNGMMNLQAVADAGYRFVFIKASEGARFRDENFRLNYDKARNAGLRTGAYHFFRFDRDPEEQAMNVHRTIEGRYLDLGVAIDVEEHGNPAGYKPAEISRNVLKMARKLERLGYHIIIYTNRDGYYDYIEPSARLREYSLWICSFYRDPINASWEFWQYDHHGQVPGIKGDVDLNTFYGTEQEWKNLFPGSDVELQ